MSDLLRIPERCNTVAEALGAASKLDLRNVAVLSEREDGSLVLLSSDLSYAQCSWLFDRAKFLMLSGRTD